MNIINTQPQFFHIAYGVDKNFVYGAGISIISILENNKNSNFVFHIFAFSIFEEDLDRLKEIEQKYSTEINIKIIDESTFHNIFLFEKKSAYNASIFTRVLIPELVSEKITNILYLDADILCTGSIDELLNLDLSKYVAAVVKDVESTSVGRYQVLGLDENNYFNSGFLYINIDQWKLNNIAQKVFQIVSECKNVLLLPDQDALNIILENKVKILDRKFNCIYDLAAQVGKNDFIPKNTVFVHYVGLLKPWLALSLKEANQLFLTYNEISPWRSKPFAYPKKARQVRILSRSLYRTGDKLKGFYYYFIYLKMKITDIFN